MKIQTIIILLLVLLSSSCDSNKTYERNLKDVVGEWTLKEMSYTNDSGEYIYFENPSSSIIFTDEKSNNTEGNIDRKGVLVVDGDSIDFVYQFDFSVNYLNIVVDREKIKDKPLYTFAKMQVNDFELIDKRSIIFSNAFEIVYPTNEKLTNPVYVFER
ncbi:MAG TPA: hypothetical protein PLS94_12140 [Prolixibacteraceae bacterium]|nr:hypothetical protein [Prolixibacteraceae bacterium]